MPAVNRLGAIGRVSAAQQACGEKLSVSHQCPAIPPARDGSTVSSRESVFIEEKDVFPHVNRWLHLMVFFYCFFASVRVSS
jgi:hypothetical protein